MYFRQYIIIVAGWVRWPFCWGPQIAVLLITTEGAMMFQLSMSRSMSYSFEVEISQALQVMVKMKAKRYGVIPSKNQKYMYHRNASIVTDNNKKTYSSDIDYFVRTSCTNPSNIN
jgi:hypothetical protein